MNKKELIDNIAEKTTLTKSQIRQVVEETFQQITDALKRKEKFKMIGFGSFGVRKRAERWGTNPRSGEKILIESRIAPVFSPGKVLLEELNEDS